MWKKTRNTLLPQTNTSLIFQFISIIIVMFASNSVNANWELVSGLPQKITIQCLTVSGSNIFAGTDGNGIFLSTNSGTNWTEINSGLPENSSVWSILLSGDKIFAGTMNNGVYLSTNNGTNWTRSKQRTACKY